MKSVSLKAFPRQQLRRNKVKKLRTAGRVPATIYGGRRTAQNLEVQLVELEELIHHSVSENLLVDLTVEGDATPQRLALVQDVQHNPLTGKVLHIDFHEVSADELVTITVPVEPIGEAVGVKSGGGVLEHVLFKLKIRALPKDIPEVINLDVSALEIGQSVHIGEIPAIAGVEILGSKEAPVFTVAAPIAEEAAPAEGAAAATAGEVEMIKEKKDEAGAAPAADAKKDDKAGKKDDKAPKEAEKKK
jgi:large subunit ribosomal protein L25